MRIAFYAPLKPPAHPVPSGDRAMARLLIAALADAGHAVELASTLRSFVADPVAERQAAVEAAAAAEATAIEARWQRHTDLVPDVWLTYHPYYRSPDFLGPALAQRFGLRYATVEASHAEKRATGSWARWHAANSAALDAADLHFCFTPRDRQSLAALLRGEERLVDLPPFVDARPFLRPEREPSPARDVVEIVTVAMMRPGKVPSYAMLAEALRRLPAEPAWRLTVLGTGPAAVVVREAFAGLPEDRIGWRGQLATADLAGILHDADLFAWPGFNEAFGVSYLEAQAAGLPVVAMRSGGVPSVVEDGKTGLLTPEGDVPAYAAALAMLIRDAGARRRLGQEAARFAREERTVAAAGRILSRHLGPASSDLRCSA